MGTAMTPMYCVLTIVERDMGRKVGSVYNATGLPVKLMLGGFGTASSEIMDYLGLDEPQKDIVVGIVPAGMRRRLFYNLDNKLNFAAPGTGIAFTIPITRISAQLLKKLSLSPAIEDGVQKDSIMTQNSENSSVGTESSLAGNALAGNALAGNALAGNALAGNALAGNALAGNILPQYEVVVCLARADDSDIIVKYAREAGARGGTVIKAKELSGSEKSKSIFGFFLEPEREIIFMLVPTTIKSSVMSAVYTGYRTETGRDVGIFALPVGETTIGRSISEIMNDGEN